MLPKGVRKDVKRLADGREATYYYDRATGRKIAGEPGTEEFKQSLAAIRQIDRERHTAGTFAGLLRQFEQSRTYDVLAEETKKQYVRRSRIIDKKWGWVPVPALTDIAFKRDVLEWHEEIAKRSASEADYLVGGVARVLSWASKKAIISHNILADIERAYERPDRSEIIWLPEHIEKFAAVADWRMYRAMMLGLHTGQREWDILDLKWSDYDGERVSLTQHKTGQKISIRCTRPLKELLDGVPRDNELIVPAPRGGRWKGNTFRRAFRETRRKAGLSDTIHFHDLRGTAVTMLFEAGCTVAEAASITGHSLRTAQKILDVYLARTRTLADAAILKFEQHPRLVRKQS